MTEIQESNKTISKLEASVIARKEMIKCKNLAYFVMCVSLFLIFLGFINKIFTVVFGIILITYSAFTIKTAKGNIEYLENKYNLEPSFDAINSLRKMQKRNIENMKNGRNTNQEKQGK